jgi:hypothetical protein
VFDPFTVRTLYLELDPSDWDRVRTDVPVEGDAAGQERAPAYFHGEGESAILVSVRRKGPTDPALPSEGNPQKVSLKIDINEYVPGQRWNGLRKLSLEVGGAESGPLEEGFAWQVHRAAVQAGMYGYDAANSAWVKLYVNGEYKGVFTNAEQRDEQFLKNRDLYSPTNTWLYKIDGSDQLEIGVGDSPTQEHLCYAPFDGFKKIGGGGGGSESTDSCLQPDLDFDLPQWIDMKSMLTLGVCNAFVENNDALFTHSGKNSFAIDFNPPQQRRRMYVPWDLDASIKRAETPIYGSEPYQQELLGHPWFGRVYEHIFRELLDGELSPEALIAFLDQLEPVLTPALEADPYISLESGVAGKFDKLRTWVVNRAANVPTQFVHPFVPRPVFNQDGGEVLSGFELTMSTPSGDIYYTTDGTDPRAPGNGISPNAVLYTAPVVVDRTLRITARTFDGTNWSGLSSDATFDLSNYATPLRVTEIMYNPVDENPADAIDEDGYEFIELRNTGAEDVDVSGYYFEGITFAFGPGTMVAAGGYVVLVRNPDAFGARYPGVPYDGVYTAKLSNGGEKIRLKNAQGTTLISVDYDDDPPWTFSPDGLGYSLVNIDPDGDPDEPNNWRPSTNVHGSPGGADPAPPYPLGLRINEVLANAPSSTDQAVEILNAGDSAADISGWFLSDQARQPAFDEFGNPVPGPVDPELLKKYRLPSGSNLSSGGFMAVFEEDFFWSNPDTPFLLNEFGGRVFLSSADAAGNLTGQVLAIDYPATSLGVSYGWVETSRGGETAPLASPTLGTANSAPRVGPVVISEIMYNPDPTGSEYVELRNISGSVVDISGWDIDGIGGFSFPSGTNVPPGGFVLLVDSAKTTASAFRADYAVPFGVPIFMDLFDLGNGGETLRLDRPNPVNPSVNPDILVERIRYNDKSPWPTEADGNGPSLERYVLAGYGNEPLNWRTAAIEGSPGREASFDDGIAVAANSSWDYRVTASTLGSDWKEVAYNATGWPGGSGPLGYGETFLSTVVPFGPDPLNKYPTTYFRKPFVVNDNPASVLSLTLSMLYDDGVVVYLNGQEVARRSLPGDPITYSTLATDNEATTYETIDLTAFSNLLVQGGNVLAVEVHQSYSTTSSPSDSDFDGMPDEWEDANGLDSGNPADALADLDGDGQNSRAEYHAGTDPNDPNSVLRIFSVGRDAGGSPMVQWYSVSGKSYRVVYSPDLSNWFSFGSLGDVFATSGTSQFVDPSSVPAAGRYYRVEVIGGP